MAKKAEVITEEVIRQRLKEGHTEMTAKEFKAYMAMKDDLGTMELVTNLTIPPGFKRCGKCGHIKKFHEFNRNSATKAGCTGTCKECQKASAKASYKRTKKKRNYKKYYEEHKEEKRENARKYYEENKHVILSKQHQYHGSSKGRKVMQKSHAKRRENIRNNSGIAYTRPMVIDRDSEFLGHKYPICNICGAPIKDLDGQHLHLDHVVPLVIGGKDCFTNVACVHAECNLRKEKDARETSEEEVTRIIDRADAYMEAHPDMFEI